MNQTVTCRLVFYFVFTFLFVQLSGNPFREDTVKKVLGKVPVYETVRLSTEKPKIDGKLDDACWATGNWAGDFIQWIPKEGAKPSQPTVFKILYDDQNIYVAMRCYDSEPEKIQRRAGRRDELTGDMAGVCFDSYHDRRTGFEFDMSAAGQKLDLILTNPMEVDLNWNAVWFGKVAMEDSAWTIEMEIPLSQLRYSSADEQIWGMHVWRWIDRYQEESDWEPQTSTGPGVLYLFGELRGIKGLKKSQRIELMPYASGKLKTFKKEPGNPFADKGRTPFGNVGLDAKIGVGSNFTVDLTLNPDFGQVESDPSVMNLTAFETFYEEKRPFFLEGKNIFNFNLDDMSIFYSRRIGHSPSYSPTLNAGEYLKTPDNTTILSAVKFSGKTANGLSVGVLQSLTANENATIKSDADKREVRVEPLTNYMVGRVQQDYNKSNTILGGMFTSTNRFINHAHLDFMNREAYTGGMDLLHYWNDKEYFIETKLIGSHIQGHEKAIQALQWGSAHYYQRPDAHHLSFDSTLNQLSGFGGKLKIGKGSKGLWRYSAEVSWKSPGLDLNDIGFMQTADMISQKNMISYFVNQPVSVFRTYRIGLVQGNNWDFSGKFLASGAELSLYGEFLNKWSVSHSLEYNGKILDTRVLRGGNAMLLPALWQGEIVVRTDYSKRVSGVLEVDADLSDNNSYRFFGVNPGISVRPADKIRMSLYLDYSINKDNLQYVSTEESGGEKKHILAHIDQETLGLTFRVDYNITPELSLQYYGSPFATTGSFSRYKVITNPKASNYNQRFSAIAPVAVNSTDFGVDENGDMVPEYTFRNPDFNFNQMRSNLVFRWEYRPGSQLYLVWSNERTDWYNPGRAPLRDAATRLSDVSPDNIFMIKFNYWFSL
jgi:hypothetical protein